MSSGIRTNTFTPLDNLRMPVQLTCMLSVMFLSFYFYFIYSPHKSCFVLRTLMVVSPRPIQKQKLDIIKQKSQTFHGFTDLCIWERRDEGEISKCPEMCWIMYISTAAHCTTRWYVYSVAHRQKSLKPCRFFTALGKCVWKLTQRFNRPAIDAGEAQRTAGGQDEQPEAGWFPWHLRERPLYSGPRVTPCDEAVKINPPFHPARLFGLCGGSTNGTDSYT